MGTPEVTHPMTCFPLFLLGGHDLEMLTIRELLQVYAPDAFIDKRLVWGARASDYRPEIDRAIKNRLTPVLIELQNDLGLSPPEVIIIDHHGPLAGADAPTSLHQVFELLGLPPEAWTRRMELVAANDRGHIQALKDIGATGEEIAEIRAADRATQGITPEEERQAEEALAAAVTVCGGALTIVSIPHGRTAAVTDRFAPELGGPGVENLLVVSPGEASFFGSGHMVALLARRYPGGWYGGSLPERGYFGISPSPDDFISYLQDMLCETPSQN